MEMVLTIGILADTPRAATGMAVVNHNLTLQLRGLDPDLRIIYFARFEAKSGVAPNSSVYEGYEIVGCEGGVWKTEIVQEIIDRYNVKIIYSEDDWWSAKGLVNGTKNMDVPLYLMTPIDSLPIQREANNIFKNCKKVFIPNQSYKYVDNGVYLPHAVDWMAFRPIRRKAFKNFTFLWIGRIERRKNLLPVILAYNKIRKKVDCNLVVRANWGATPMARAMNQFIDNKGIPILKDRMINCPHDYLANIYSSCHAFICSSKAGACEMSVLEAQACALPVIVTDWTFMSENLIDGKTGFKIPVDGYDFRDKIGIKNGEGKGRIWGNISTEKLADRMLWMVENQKRSWKMGINGMEYIRKNYSWENIAKRFYEEVILDFEVENNK